MTLTEPGPADCSCLWVGEVEFWAGDPVTVWTLREKDRRCAVHGKPRHSKGKKPVAYGDQRF